MRSTFVPSHELIARFSAQFAGQRFTLSPEIKSRPGWNGGDLRGVDVPYPVGSIVVLEDDNGVTSDGAKCCASACGICCREDNPTSPLPLS